MRQLLAVCSSGYIFIGFVCGKSRTLKIKGFTYHHPLITIGLIYPCNLRVLPPALVVSQPAVNSAATIVRPNDEGQPFSNYGFNSHHRCSKP